MNEPRKYRKKPVVIEAMVFDGTVSGALAAEDWIATPVEVVPTNTHHVILIPTLEGKMQANPGDYIIRGVQGEFYPCKPDIFAATYEEVDDELATIARDEWKKPRSCPSCGEYMVHIDTAEIVQQETAEYVLRAREAEAEADKWREAAFCVAYAWWEQDEESATDYLWYRGWDTTLDGPLSFEALVEDVRQQPHPEAVKQNQR